jgi:hypothetical protein
VVDDTGVWLYGICEHMDIAMLGGVCGVGQATVRLIMSAGLTAIVSDVSLAAFGEAALRCNLEDLDWVADTARAHHRVIDTAVAHAQVLPARLATVYTTDAGIALLCQHRWEGFRDLLTLLAHHREWGVKAYATPVETGSAPPTEPMSGTAYLRRRREQLSATTESRREAAACAEAIHAELSRLAAQARPYPPQSQQLSGEKAAMILNAAYLVDDRRSPEFAAAVSSATNRYTGVRLVLTGPWPAYSFTGIEEHPDNHHEP